MIPIRSFAISTVKRILYKGYNTHYLFKKARNKEIKRIKRLDSQEVHTTNLFSNPIKFVDPNTFLATYNEIFNSKVYYFKSQKENPVIIDCGASIGIAIIYFKSLYPKSKIIAFEPDYNIFNLLKYNVSSMGYADVQLYNSCVWTKNGNVAFSPDGQEGGRIVNGQVNNDNVVKSVDLRDFLNDNIDFLKIDIEGAERYIIPHCGDLLKNVNNIFVEYHSLVNEEQKIGDIISSLEEADFRIYITSHTQTSLTYREIKRGKDMYLNIFGYRNI